MAGLPPVDQTAPTMSQSEYDTARERLLATITAATPHFHRRLNQILDDIVLSQLTDQSFSKDPFQAFSLSLFGDTQGLPLLSNQNQLNLNKPTTLVTSKASNTSSASAASTTPCLRMSSLSKNSSSSKLGAVPSNSNNSPLLAHVDFSASKLKSQDAPTSATARRRSNQSKQVSSPREPEYSFSTDTASEPEDLSLANTSSGSGSDLGSLVIDEESDCEFVIQKRPLKAPPKKPKLLPAGSKRPRPHPSESSDSGRSSPLIEEIEPHFGAKDAREGAKEGPSKPAKVPRRKSRQSSTVFVQDETVNNFAMDNRKENTITVNFKCLVDGCTVYFTEKTVMLKHMESEHQVRQYRCQVEHCGTSFKTQQNLTTHLTTIHEDLKIYQCSKCPRNYRSYALLAHHHYTDHDLGLFKCAIADCDTSSCYRFEISRHFEQEHRSYVCQYPGCNRQFTYTGHLRQHERTHLNCKAYSCTWTACEYSTGNLSHLVCHIRTKHFKLPNTLKKQQERGIVDSRDPKVYVHVDEEKLKQVEEVMARLRAGKQET